MAKASPNRTIKELKHQNDGVLTLSVSTPNRTIKELKLICGVGLGGQVLTPNRTIKELKRLLYVKSRTCHSLPIAPLRNWNKKSNDMEALEITPNRTIKELKLIW